MRARNLPASEDLKKTKSQLIEELGLWRSGQMRAAPGLDNPPDFYSAQVLGIVQSADDAIISMDEAHGIRMFSGGAARIFGYTAEEVIGQSIDMLLPEEVRRRHGKHVNDFLKGGEGSRLMGQRAEVFGLRKNGEIFPAEASICKNEVEGKILFTAILRDITERRRAEDELENNQQLLQTVFDAIPARITVRNEECRLIIVNKHAAQTMDLTPGEFLALDGLYPALDEQEAAEREATDRQILKDGRTIQFENFRSWKSGLKSWHQATRVALKNSGGKIIGVVGITQDITERKRAEESLTESEERFRSVMDNSPSSMFLKDLEGRYTLVNRAFAERRGCTEDDMIGKTAYDLYPKDTATIIADHEKEVVATRGQVEREHEFAFGDGSRHVVLTTKFPVFDQDKRINGIGTISTDITERKRTEEALRDSEQRFRGLLDHSPSSMSLKDLEGRYTLVNRVFAERRGCTEDDMIGKTVFDFQSKEIAELVTDHEREVLATGSFVEREHETAFSDGSRHMVLTAKFPVFDHENRIIGLGTIVTDISERKRAEIALRESEQRFRSVIDHSPSVIHLKDLQGRYTMVNRTFAERRGCPIEKIIGKAPSDFYGQDFADSVAERDRKVVATGKIDEWEHENTFGDGSKHIIVSTKFPVFDQEHRIIGVGTITNDTTERNQAENALRESEERFRSVIDHSPSAIFLKDLEGRYILVNRIVAGRSGHSEAEMIGKTAEEVFPAGFAQRVSDQDAEVLKTGKVIGREHELPPRDGIERIVLTTKFPVMNSEGSIIAIGTISTDVTEQKRAEQDLLASQRLLTAVINTIDHWVYAKDVESRYLLVNNAMASELGLIPEDMVGRETAAFRSELDTRYGSDEELEALVAMDRKVIETGESQHAANFVLTSPDGGRRIHRISKMPLTDESGAAVGVVGMSENITQHTILEQQLRESQKMEAVGQLAGGIAHEFNNMLQVIVNSAQFLKIQLGDAGKDQNMVDIILRSSERSAKLTRQLLAFSRKSVIQPVVMQLDQFISDEMIMLGRVIGENFQIEFQSHGGLWPMKADPGVMGQIILNLCINARDAMPNGGRILIESENFTATSEYAAVHGLESAGDYVMIVVSDNGIGMTPENRERIFEPFFTTKEVGQGTGLGLAMVQGAIQQHHGAIEVASELGKGTAFTIYFPRTESAEQAPAVTAQQDAAGGDETILVAEDELDVLGVLKQALKSRGYRVLTAVDGRDALAVYEANAEAINLVILDMVMPFMSGREVFTKIREEGSKVPILFSSGYSPRDDDYAFLIDNGIPWILKPYAIHDLYAAVRQALDDEDQAAASS